MQVINPYLGGFGSGGARNTALLSTIVPGVEFELDATINGSYSGSGQTWANRETSPISGAAQTAYDHVLGNTSGVSANDPTFTGTPDTAGAYFALDGSDWFTLAGASTTFLKNLHKTTGGQAFSIVVAGRFASSSGTNQAIFGTRSGSDGIGIFLGVAPAGTNNKIAITIAVGGTVTTTTIACPTTADGTDKVLIITLDPATGAYKVYVNSNTPTTGTLTAYTSTTDGGTAQMAARGGSLNPLLSGARLKGAAMYNKVLSDSEVQSIITALNSRYGW